ncbi:hypothetical protein [Yersinia ruckeri]|uniref:hypothetical protein n=1 Tax=Yersinia ruckeri TaxID=29486 RepID=UPI00226456A5|nr:hypothetical protein [Yersinia ruckeri]UZX69996.1 hypothetical protein ND437_08230 [Yersinia ruckeri]
MIAEGYVSFFNKTMFMGKTNREQTVSNRQREPIGEGTHKKTPKDIISSVWNNLAKATPESVTVSLNEVFNRFKHRLHLY